ncbi:MAG: Hsp20/alpha crystallin family protein [Candidatus Acidiferrales bacterium]
MAPLNCGHLLLDDKIRLSTDAAYFEKGDVEVCVEPRRLTICGTASRCSPLLTPESSSLQAHKDLIFRTLDLPVEIEASQATARFRGRFLEIDLPKAGAIRQIRGAKKAA